jgi:phytoene desaturase
VLTRNFWQQVSRYFDSEIAREIVSLVAFFLGRTPFDTSAIYTLLSYTEFRHDGYFNVEGGMYKIVEGVVSELKKAGGEIIYNTEIVDFKKQNGKIVAFVDKENREWKADYYVANADAAVFRGKVLRRSKYSEVRLDKKEWTMGPLTIYLGINKKLPHVEHHNYYLGDNFREYANKVFQNPGTIQKPYYYVNVLSKSNPDCAPEGYESLFFVCPVPDLRFKPDWSDRDAIVDSIIQDFSKRIGTDIASSIVTKTIYTPIDWQDQFNLHRGSGLGLSHSMMQIGALRPKNFDEEFTNLFYVGASTVPGTGLPMGIISSKLAVERILKQE